MTITVEVARRKHVFTTSSYVVAEARAARAQDKSVSRDEVLAWRRGGK